MENRCKLCHRKKRENSEYCPYHGKAFDNLREAFERWKRAFDIDWDDYLRQIAENTETGEWARDVAESLM